MKNTLTFLFLAFLALGFQSCEEDTPQHVFGATTLNVNKYISFGAEDFTNMQAAHEQGALYAMTDDNYAPSDSYEAHVTTFKLLTLNKDIENIQSLTKTDETKDIIKASLEVFNFVKEKYETDYVRITKLLDSKADEGTVNAAILEFNELNVPKLQKKIDALHVLALPYAEANGIEVSFF